MQRLIAYVDGFNLYFGLREKGWKRYYWLNIQLLVQNLLKPNQNLVRTKYFSSRISSPPDKVKRQSTFIEALETLSNFEFFWGHYQLNTYTCQKCNSEYDVPNEKRTDVNIAVEMVRDAYEDRFDVAMLISGDGDLVPAVKAVKESHQNKRVVVAFPPKRRHSDLANIADGSFVIGRVMFEKSLFPMNVVKKDGFVLQCPSTWK